MNKFENQITHAAKQLRDRENKKLRTPQQLFKKPNPTKYWMRMAAACFIGFSIGHFVNSPKSTIDNTIAQVLDTVYQTRTIYDTIYLTSEKAIATPTKNNHPKKKPAAPPTSSPIIQANLLAGKNILKDSIDFTLLASL